MQVKIENVLNIPKKNMKGPKKCPVKPVNDIGGVSDSHGDQKTAVEKCHDKKMVEKPTGPTLTPLCREDKEESREYHPGVTGDSGQ